jgi:hypothetical protein
MAVCQVVRCMTCGKPPFIEARDMRPGCISHHLIGDSSGQDRETSENVRYRALL